MRTAQISVTICLILAFLQSIECVRLQKAGLSQKITQEKEFLEKLQYDDQNRQYLIEGTAHDVAVGPDGSYWLIGSDIEVGGYGIYKWNTEKKSWEKIPGSGVRISVDPEGNPWIVNKQGNILKYDQGSWVKLPGTGYDISVGADNTVWHIGTDGSLNRLNPDRTTWQKIDGAGIRLAVNPNGYAWYVNSKEEIYRYNGSGWDRMPGKAIDIGIGADGSIVIAGMTKLKGGYEGLRWNGAVNEWEVIPGLSAINVAVGPAGELFVADRELQITTTAHL